MTRGQEKEKEKPAKDSQATIIVRDVTEDGATPWHTPDGDAYLSIPVNGHVEHHPLRTAACRDYLSRVYFRRARSAASSNAIADAQDTLSALARFEGESFPVYVRLAAIEDRVYLDLGDPGWRVVEIDPTGWRVLTDAPVRFRRPKGLRPLPVPVAGGSIAQLLPFLNVSSDDDFRLCVSWVLAGLRGCGPYPVAMMTAEQGAAKTTTTKVLRQMIDPNVADTRRPPRSTHDLMIAAANSYIVAFDNLSTISDELSDTLSALATGSGFSVRQLYSNDEEHICYACRPIILNGISQFASRGDLLDRALSLTLPRIPDTRRKDERTFWQDFTTQHPQLLGAFLDAIVIGLRRVSQVQIPKLPRMADFVTWIVAVEPACPWPIGRFQATYGRNRMNAVTTLLDGDPLADAVRALADVSRWQGTATDLLNEVNRRTPDDLKRRREWFSQPKQVSDHLRRLAPALRKMGITVTRIRVGHQRSRLICIRRTYSGRADSGASASAASAISPEYVASADGADGADATEPPFSFEGDTAPPFGISREAWQRRTK